MLAGSGAARHYGYSSARVKAMEARLITKKTMQDIVNAKETSNILAILFQGDYKEDIEAFGGLAIKQEMIDFALSKNLAKNSAKLVQISPTTERKIMRGIVGKWELGNIKLGLEAKDRNVDYDHIASLIVDFGRHDANAVKDAMREDTIEGMMNKFMINSPYAKILHGALEAYRKTKNVADAIAEIDKGYYRELGNVILGLRVIHNESAIMLKMDIDMKNLMILVKAKRSNMKFGDISNYIIPGGRMKESELEQLFTSGKDVESMMMQVKTYDLKEAVEMYKSNGRKRLIVFEIGLKNAILNDSMRLLKHSILSFGAILAYSYLKEIEIFTLRILIHSRMYGLSKEETERLLVWRNA